MAQPTRRWMLGALPALGLVPSAKAQQADPRAGLDAAKAQQATSGHFIDSWVDIYGRPTAKVIVNGRGPFEFLVDTGSAATVIAERHLSAMSAQARGKVTVNGATGSAIMPLVELASLQAGAAEKRNLRVAVLPNERLKREDGILGGDVFAGQQLVFDIRAKTIRIESGARPAETSAPANMRIRNGLLAEIEGRVGTIPTRLMLDTGAKSSVANPALDEILMKRYPRLVRIDHAQISGVTGHRVMGQLVFLPKVDMKAFTVQDSSCIAADASIFDLWGLKHDPALIVGIDLLSRLESFSINYGTRNFDAVLAEALMARNAAALG